MNLPEQQLGAWVEAPGKDARIELRQIEIPKPGPGEVLVKIEVSGVWYVTFLLYQNSHVCSTLTDELLSHSDHHSIYGTTPMTTHVAGHEGVGKVIAGSAPCAPYMLSVQC